MRFSYLPVSSLRPVVALGGRRVRPRPLIGLSVVGPSGLATLNGLLDTGSDDTVFPEDVAARVGVDLSRAPVQTTAGMGQGTFPVRFAFVSLRIADNQERREWSALVGFTPFRVRHGLLGFAGFLQFFTATFHGDREEVELTVNGLYPGT